MCNFCAIAGGEVPAHVVFEDASSMAFLDNRPLFAGHTLLIPRAHFETIVDLPEELISPYFGAVRFLSGVVPAAMGAAGTFVAMNNKVSQSVPHLHTHIVPRRPKDGLRGFFWPRTKYTGEAQMDAVAAAIRAAVEERRG